MEYGTKREKLIDFVVGLFGPIAATVAFWFLEAELALVSLFVALGIWLGWITLLIWNVRRWQAYGILFGLIVFVVTVLFLYLLISVEIAH